VAVWNLFDYLTVDLFCEIYSAFGAALGTYAAAFARAGDKK
jgi:hypothetical protein